MAGDRQDQPLPRVRGGGALRKLGRRLLGPLAQVGRSLEPAVRLAGADATTARSWLRNVGAVQEALGGDLARAYGDLLVRAALTDTGIARELAIVIPDQLARVAPAFRRRFLVAVEWTLERQPTAAVPVASNLAPALAELDDEGLRRFIKQAAALALESSRKAASFLRGESGQGRQAIHQLESGLALADVQRVLALYAAAHCGEHVRVEPAPIAVAEPGFHPLRAAAGGLAHTDGHGIHLPSRVQVFADERDFLVYRVLTALCVGYLEFGTFDFTLETLEGEWPRRRPGELELQCFFRGLGNRSLASDLFQVFEDVRIEAVMRRTYPGLARDLDRLRKELPRTDLRGALEQLSPVDQLVALLAFRAWSGVLPPGHQGCDRDALTCARGLESSFSALAAEGSSVLDTARALKAAWPSAMALIRSTEVQGSAARGGPASNRGRTGGGPPDSGLAARGSAEKPGDPQPGERGGFRELVGRATGGLLRPERRDAAAEKLDDQAYEARARAKERGEEGSFTAQRQRLLRQRERSDYAEMDAWLSTMEGPRGGIVERTTRSGPAPLPATLRQDVEPLALQDPSAYSYAEWDATIGDYRPSWVLVRELPLSQGSGDFVERVMAGYRPQIQSLRRQFEALRPSELELVRGLEHGDTLDLDRVVEAITVRRAGGSPSDRLYLRHERSRRDVAVAFLLDMSSSTNEVVSGGGKRIIEVEKEALVLIAEAVDAIGDRFAVWGFSGYGRDQVAFYVAKSFRQPYDQAARERIGGMSWKMENRDGAAIRHATRLLLEEPARIRLLVLLSDGKPLDCGCDQYSDAYAQEDTRKALMEAREVGLHPFCITVDPHSRDYLRQMYGTGSYTIIDRVEALPLRIPKIYRRLTR